MLLVACYVGPNPGRVAEWSLGAGSDDVERAVVVLDVGVTEAHIFVGVAILQWHSNCDGSNLQSRRGIARAAIVE